MEHLVLPALGLSGLIGLVTFVFHNNKSNDNKVSRVYTRLDEVKAFNDNTFVRNEMCQMISKQLKDDVSEIKHDVKQLLRNGKDK